MNMLRKKSMLPWLVVAMAAIAAVLLAKSREAPQRRQPPTLAPLVEVVTVKSTSLPAVVRGHGSVRPRRVVELVPQVAGQVQKMHASFVSGGLFEKGDLLVQIDPRDFELAVRRNEAELARAQVRLETERAEAEIARDEWDRLHPGKPPVSPLVVREPQIRQAEAELAAAQANVDRARLDLERSTLRAPFDGRVDSERVEVGQFLVIGQPVATLHGTERLEIPVPLEDRELEWFAIGDSCEVVLRFAGGRHLWTGKVSRIEGVDPATRMVTVVVEIDIEEDSSSGKMSLLPGMFAEVAISGASAEGISIPRSVLRSDEKVWLVDPEGRLQIRDVEVGRSDRDQALVLSGLQDGDRLVVTSLDAVTDGMEIRVAGDEKPGGLS